MEKFCKMILWPTSPKIQHEIKGVLIYKTKFADQILFHRDPRVMFPANDHISSLIKIYQWFSNVLETKNLNSLLRHLKRLISLLSHLPWCFSPTELLAVICIQDATTHIGKENIWFSTSSHISIECVVNHLLSLLHTYVI